MLKTSSAARRAKLLAAAVLAAYAMGAAAAHAGVTAIGESSANYAAPSGDPSLYPNPKDPVPSLYPNPKDPVGGFGNSGSGGSDPKGVPEPASWALMAVGFAALGFVAYRAKRRPALV
ncbi:MAG: PEP-CTERM sorting domain-containing protein [Hyphomicrobiales bacterium]|nr:PEP-CTERM sorting domain-containing protein [Hyphomicrobiales bacterium]MBV8441916.1 PEP-CTERM sorting domain-containing protein [Hyphomicrobiales bacterium]